MVCYDAFENFFYFSKNRFEEYGGFASATTAFFQNLIGNAITLTKY